jgi:hypothetical protein
MAELARVKVKRPRYLDRPLYSFETAVVLSCGSSGTVPTRAARARKVRMSIDPAWGRAWPKVDEVWLRLLARLGTMFAAAGEAGLCKGEALHAVDRYEQGPQTAARHLRLSWGILTGTGISERDGYAGRLWLVPGTPSVSWWRSWERHARAFVRGRMSCCPPCWTPGAESAPMSKPETRPTWPPSSPPSSRETEPA